MCAILVGGYATLDEANAALKKVQKWPTPDIHLPSGAPPFMSRYEMILDKTGSSVMENGKPKSKVVMLNPCPTAFAIRNPTLVDEQAAGKAKFDPAWRVMNSEEQYSVYKCKKPWTLAIAQYRLYNGVQPKTEPGSLLDTLLPFGGHKQDPLDTAAVSANSLANFLHKNLNMEAYVLHTQTGSVVTVAGFDRWDDPSIDSMRTQIYAVRQKIAENARSRGLAPPPFFDKPLPMEVPH
jgi:hypothetical protein